MKNKNKKIILASLITGIVFNNIKSRELSNKITCESKKNEDVDIKMIDNKSTLEEIEIDFETEFDIEFTENKENHYTTMEFIDNGKGEACAVSLINFKLNYDNEGKKEVWISDYAPGEGEFIVLKKNYHHKDNEFRYKTMFAQATGSKHSHTLYVHKKEDKKTYNFKVIDNGREDLTFYYKILSIIQLLVYFLKNSYASKVTI